MSEHRHKSDSLPQLQERLRKFSRKITGPRQAILDVLRRDPGPRTIKGVHLAISAECDLATVYRSMRTLEEAGMVKRFDFGDGSARYELLREGDDGHHHHLICVTCNQVLEIEDCYLDELDTRIATQNGYKAVSHRLEFFGICPGCQR